MWYGDLSRRCPSIRLVNPYPIEEDGMGVWWVGKIMPRIPARALSPVEGDDMR
jgi:hypothetical protein